MQIHEPQIGNPSSSITTYVALLLVPRAADFCPQYVDVQQQRLTKFQIQACVVIVPCLIFALRKAAMLHYPLCWLLIDLASHLLKQHYILIPFQFLSKANLAQDLSNNAMKTF